MGWRAAFIALITALLCAAPASAATLTVTTSGDPGGTCEGTSCTTLRAALTEAARLAGTDTIVVPAGVISISNDFVINQPVQIIGASARTTIIDANAKSRAFRITAEGTLQLANVTVRNGVSGGGDELDGGGIHNAGNLQLVNVRVTGNATQTGGRGGGIANDLGYLVADNLLVDNNLSDNGAGGIHNTGGQEIPNLDGWLILTDSTIFKNTSGLGGVGGIQSTGTGAAVSLSRSTVADNTAGARGIGGLVPSGNSQVVGSILARNLVLGETVNCGSVKPTDAHFNVEDDTDCALAPGGMKPGLATALSNQGGQLDVLAITQGGDAFNRMPLGDTPCEGTDQRGTARPQSAACDAGAFELVVPPFVTVTSGPNGTVTGSQVEFNFQADRTGVTVQCDLTGPGQTAGYEPCYKENAQPYTGLADGPYTFSVRAVNTQYPDAPATTRTFVVNTAPPNTTITAGPTGLTNDSTPTFTFSSSETGSTFQCRVGTAAFAACTSPHTTAALADGARTFEVRAIDAASVADPTPASRSLTVDTTAPETTIGSGGPSGLTANTSATFTFTSNDPAATFQCSLDGAAFGACPVNYTGLSQGAHTFQVRATDAAGNTDASPASRSWTVDSVAPTVAIDASPARTNDTTPSFTFSASETATYQCRTDAGAFAACTSPYTTAALSEGNHTVDIRATDAAGNQGAAANRAIVIDLTGPTVTINSGPTGPTNDNTPTYAFSSEAGATFECRVDSAAFATCGSPHTTATLADGARTFQVRAIDGAGNAGAAVARGLTVDTAAPAAPVITTPTENQLLAVGTVNMAGTAEPNATLQVTEGAAPAGSSPVSGTGTWNVVLTPSDGTHTYTARATDAAGNQGAATTRTIRIDTALPDTTITSGPSGTTADTTPTWTFSSTEAGSTFECALDGAAHTACATPFTPTLTAGLHTLSVRAVDPAGNRDNTPATRSITIDVTAPTVTITAGPANPTNVTNPSFTFSSTDTAATLQCRIDAGAFTACTSPHTRSVTAEGAHNFTVQATDTAGNTATDTWTFTTDTTRPNTTINSGPASPGNDTTPEFTFSSNEANASFECRVGSAAFASCTSPHTVAPLPVGGHTLEVRAIDRAGNADDTPATRSFIIDTTAPSPPSLPSAPSPIGNDTTPTFEFTGEANATFQCRLDTPTFTACTSPLTTSALSDGSHAFAVRAVDAAGNVSTATTWNFVVDTAAPSAPVVQAPTQNQWLTTSGVTVSGTAEAGASIEVKEGALTRGTVTATAGGTWSVAIATVTDGTHTYAVTARDPAANTSTATNRTFRVDTVAPSVPTISAATVDGSDVTLSGGAEANATVEILDGGTLVATVTATASATWLRELTGIVDGVHPYTVRARDAAGNVSGASAVRTVSVDTGPPPAPGIAGPSGPTNDATPTFTFSGETTAFECSLDGTAPVGCASPLTLPALADGTHTLRVKVIDTAGNASPETVRTFVVDTAPPAAGVTGGPDGATTDSSPAFPFTASESQTECRLDGPSGVGAYEACLSPKTFAALAPGAYEFFVRVTDAAGNQAETRRPFTVTQVQAAQTPTPTPTPSATPTPVPTPVVNQTIVVTPAKTGTVLVKEKGASKFEPLDITKGIKNGSEVDVRNGRVTLTSIPKAGAPPETADFYGGMFIVTQKGGITDLKLSERLTGCPKGQQASLSQKKTKSRKLWGNGKGSFRTSGKYSAATVRGTIWLVQDSCTTTLTRVTAGVVQVNDFVKKKKFLVKKGKRYTAKAKKR